MIARGKPLRRAGSRSQETHVRLRQAFPGMSAINRNWTEGASLAISPPSDIVLDVARAAEPATLESSARQAGEPRRRHGIPAWQRRSRSARPGAPRSPGRHPLTEPRPNPTSISRRWC